MINLLKSKKYQKSQKKTQRKKIYWKKSNDFGKEMILREITESIKVNYFLYENVKPSFKAFDNCPEILQPGNRNSIEISVKSLKQTLFDEGIFDGVENEN